MASNCAATEDLYTSASPPRSLVYMFEIPAFHLEKLSIPSKGQTTKKVKEVLITCKLYLISYFIALKIFSAFPAFSLKFIFKSEI